MLIPNDSIKFGEHHALSKRSRLLPASCWRPAGLPGRLSVSPAAEHRRAWGERTRRKLETLARNRAIFRDYTAGSGVDELSARYLLPQRDPKDFTLGRRGLLEP
ncbi:MAG: hypothetical protein ACLRWL_05590 [Evtepia gabavorous]